MRAVRLIHLASARQRMRRAGGRLWISLRRAPDIDRNRDPIESESTLARKSIGRVPSVQAVVVVERGSLCKWLVQCIVAPLRA